MVNGRIFHAQIGRGRWNGNTPSQTSKGSPQSQQSQGKVTGYKDLPWHHLLCIPLECPSGQTATIFRKATYSLPGKRKMESKKHVTKTRIDQVSFPLRASNPSRFLLFLSFDLSTSHLCLGKETAAVSRLDAPSSKELVIGRILNEHAHFATYAPGVDTWSKVFKSQPHKFPHFSAFTDYGGWHCCKQCKKRGVKQGSTYGCPQVFEQRCT